MAKSVMQIKEEYEQEDQILDLLDSLKKLKNSSLTLSAIVNIIEKYDFLAEKRSNYQKELIPLQNLNDSELCYDPSIGMYICLRNNGFTPYQGTESELTNRADPQIIIGNLEKKLYALQEP